jgi:hypothetical protein
MALTVGIRENTLSGTKKAWRFHTSHDEIVEFDELLRRMAESRATLSAPDLGAAFMQISEAIQRLVAAGKFVKTPLGDFYVTATGSADSRQEHFEPHRRSSGHGLRLRFRPARDAELRIARAATVKRDDQGFRLLPRPTSLVPVEADAGFRPGAFACLSGCRLGFQQADGRLGVFFEPYPGPGSIAGMPPLRASIYASVKPRLVIFQLPAELERGEYRLILRSATRAGTLREGSLAASVRIG